jgi:hypothetical protein
MNENQSRGYYGGNNGRSGMGNGADGTVEIVGQTKFRVDVNGLSQRKYNDDQHSGDCREFAEPFSVELAKRDHGETSPPHLNTSDANSISPGHARVVEFP